MTLAEFLVAGALLSRAMLVYATLSFEWQNARCAGDAARASELREALDDCRRVLCRAAEKAFSGALPIPQEMMS
jgi:hypothetical protein